MANFETDRKTNLYVDRGPSGVAATVAQEHSVLGSTVTVWKSVLFTSRMLIETEKHYSKVEGESLG